MSKQILIKRKRVAGTASTRQARTPETEYDDPLERLGLMGSPVPVKLDDGKTFSFEDPQPRSRTRASNSAAPYPGDAKSAREDFDPQKMLHSFDYASARANIEGFVKSRTREKEVEQAVEKLAEDLAEVKRLKEPVNKELVKRASAYREDVPPLIHDDIEKVREFFLTQVLPLYMRIQNGVKDAIDVSRLALNEDPATTGFESMVNGYVNQIVSIKTLTFMSEMARLDPLEKQVLLLAYMTKNGILSGHGNTTEALVREMLTLSNLQRSTQDDTKALVRKVQAIEGDRKSSRSRPAANGAEGRKPRASKKA